MERLEVVPPDRKHHTGACPIVLANAHQWLDRARILSLLLVGTRESRASEQGEGLREELGVFRASGRVSE